MVGKITKHRRTEWLYGYAMVFPAFLFILVFLLWPIVDSIYLSLQKTQWFSATDFIGLGNYTKLFASKDFGIILVNTLKIVGIAVPLVAVISLFFASLLNNKIRGISLIRVSFFLPVITISVASTLVWKWILNGDYGILNGLLSRLGISKVYWLSDGGTAVFSLVLMITWGSLGNNIIILLAGLQGIPALYYEAARLDGANGWKSFRHITLPLLSPTLFFVVVTLIIRTMQVFDAPYMLIGSQKGRMYRMLGTVIYEFFYQTFISHNIGYGSAVVVAVFLIILALTVIQLLVQKLWVNYD